MRRGIWCALVSLTLFGCATSPPPGTPSTVAQPSRDHVLSHVRVRFPEPPFRIVSLDLKPNRQGERFITSLLPEDAMVWVAVVDYPGNTDTRTHDPFREPPDFVLGGPSEQEQFWEVVLDPANEQIIQSEVRLKPGASPGVVVDVPVAPIWYVGETWRFSTTGTGTGGALRVEIKNKETKKALQRVLSADNVAQFALPLDRDHLPDFRDQPFQEYEYHVSAGNSAAVGSILLVTDRDVVRGPASSFSSPTLGAKASPEATIEHRFESDFRELTAKHWHGQDLQVSVKEVPKDQVQLSRIERDFLENEKTLWIIEVRGRFPKLLVSPDQTESNKYEVMTPVALRYTVRRDTGWSVLKLHAFDNVQ